MIPLYKNIIHQEQYKLTKWKKLCFRTSFTSQIGWQVAMSGERNTRTLACDNLAVNEFASATHLNRHKQKQTNGRSRDSCTRSVTSSTADSLCNWTLFIAGFTGLTLGQYSRSRKQWCYLLLKRLEEDHRLPKTNKG